ncbi:Hypothetical predicted protein [Cloeon dipterum]|uniref:Uncharacterized protein n=1 Tax=Cloeon dipterum TaxID=197152 RepID=A0A8S1CI28_9INSE|nr:Hypothetical predicted protein [Cloeon dipterum]
MGISEHIGAILGSTGACKKCAILGLLMDQSGLLKPRIIAWWRRFRARSDLQHVSKSPILGVAVKKFIAKWGFIEEDDCPQEIVSLVVEEQTVMGPRSRKFAKMRCDGTLKEGEYFAILGKERDYYLFPNPITWQCMSRLGRGRRRTLSGVLQEQHCLLCYAFVAGRVTRVLLYLFDKFAITSADDTVYVFTVERFSQPSFAITQSSARVQWWAKIGVTPQTPFLTRFSQCLLFGAVNLITVTLAVILCFDCSPD